MGKDSTVGKPITEKGKRGISRAAAAALPALPAPLDRGNEDNEPRADPGADGEWDLQEAMQDQSPADDKQVASTGESAARGGSAGHSSS